MSGKAYALTIDADRCAKYAEISFDNQGLFSVGVECHQCASVRLCWVLTENEHRAARAPLVETKGDLWLKRAFGDTSFHVLRLNADRDTDKKNCSAIFPPGNILRLSSCTRCIFKLIIVGKCLSKRNEEIAYRRKPPSSVLSSSSAPGLASTVFIRVFSKMLQQSR